MPTVRASDSVYQAVARLAGDRGVSLSQALSELVMGGQQGDRGAGSDRLVQQFISLRDDVLGSKIIPGEGGPTTFVCPGCNVANLVYVEFREGDIWNARGQCFRCGYTIVMGEL